MKLVRFGPVGAERPGVLVGTQVIEVTDLVGDFDTAFFARGGLATLARDLQRHPTLPVHDAGKVERWAAPIARPGKVVCIGLNYAVHAAESGMELPAEPVVFFKAPSTVVGPDDDVLIPVGGTKTDWEVELGVVIGSTARYLDSTEEARDVIAGYCVSHDVSERHFQLERGGQWVKGKSCETFNPLGPWLVTGDDIADPQDLSLDLSVNGERRQDGNTSAMIFRVLEVVRYLSQFMVLEPGDLINTGTPPGVGMGMSPPQYLREGDVVELGIEGLGRQRQQVRQATRDRLPQK
jgi:2-keto-4-pentenoate hydratase/2-oxohepta-3-ene-1,7-dioic acid hydratase in catechol pathway